MRERNSLSFIPVCSRNHSALIRSELFAAVGNLFWVTGTKPGARKYHDTFLGCWCCFLYYNLPYHKEKNNTKPEQNSTIKEDLKDLVKNKVDCHAHSNCVRFHYTFAEGGMYVYYFDHYLNLEHLAAFLGKVGFNNTDAATSGFSLFNAAGIVMTLVGFSISKPLADKYGKT
jgi:hypothetical protein